MYLLFDIWKIQCVVEGSFSSFVGFPRFCQINSDSHVNANDLKLEAENKKLCLCFIKKNTKFAFSNMTKRNILGV